MINRIGNISIGLVWSNSGTQTTTVSPLTAAVTIYS